MMDIYRPQTLVATKLSKERCISNYKKRLSPTALGFNENWNTKLHGLIATKNI
jgi:hypothetical protein